VRPRSLDLAVDSLTLVSVLAQVEAVHGIEVTLDDTLALMTAPLVSDFAGRVAALVSLPGHGPPERDRYRRPAP
jgi:acyl carrier protein